MAEKKSKKQLKKGKKLQSTKAPTITLKLIHDNFTKVQS